MSFDLKRKQPTGRRMKQKQDQVCRECRHNFLHFNQKEEICEKQLDDESICGCHCKFKVSTRARRNRKGKVNG